MNSSALPPSYSLLSLIAKKFSNFCNFSPPIYSPVTIFCLLHLWNHFQESHHVPKALSVPSLDCLCCTGSISPFPPVNCTDQKSNSFGSLNIKCSHVAATLLGTQGSAQQANWVPSHSLWDLSVLKWGKWCLEFTDMVGVIEFESKETLELMQSNHLILIPKCGPQAVFWTARAFFALILVDLVILSQLFGPNLPLHKSFNWLQWAVITPLHSGLGHRMRPYL